MQETELPPLRDINHTIPLIDESKTYPWRPSRCPEAFREQWAEKRDAYLKTGHWEITSARNMVPMLLIPKPNMSNPVIGPGNAHARMPAFLAIISANFTNLLHFELSETDDCR